MVTSKTLIKLSHYQKYVGLLLVLIGIPTLLLDNAPHAELPLMVGLFTLFISSEKMEDERTVSLRINSLYVAFICGYAIKLITSNLYSHQIVGWHLTEINHFIILVFALALLIYYFRLYFSK